MGRPVTQSRCAIARECSNLRCIFKMLQFGYKISPSGDIDKRKNAELERMNGKGYYPKWDVVGKGEFVDLICNDFSERKL